MKIRAFPMLVLITGFLGTASAQAETADREDYKTQLDVPAAADAQRDPNAFRILCIGDSITRHGTSKETQERLRWGHVAGMAASKEENDYAHLLSRSIQAKMPERKVELYFHTSGGSGAARHRLSTISEVLPLQPHLVVIQLGEHEKEADGADALRANYEALVASFSQQTPKPLIIATGIWSLSKQERDSAGQLTYTGWAATVEQTMREVCERHGVTFVTVSDIAGDPANRGWGEHAGVKWHPNDLGHQGYARKIGDAYQAASASKP